ncbi:MAG TPA: DUF4468 domain-containing protein [Sphingobacteriaceae bacterium]|nr:DUF4468 domain-containing protein [Sphingobacteriaceae bacterium]
MKILTAILFFCLPIFCQAQFSLTSSGFVSASDASQTYVVFDAPGTNQQELYKKALIYLSGLYTSPKDAISPIDGEAITVNGFAKDAVKMKVLYLNPSWDINYTLSFQFKDGKMRVMQPSFNQIRTRTGDIYRTASILPNAGQNNKEIYNRKGELKDPAAKAALETFINNFINVSIQAINKPSDNNW